MHFTHYQITGGKVFAVNPWNEKEFYEWPQHRDFKMCLSAQSPITADPSIKDGVYKVDDLEIVWQYKCDPDCNVEWDGCLDNDPTHYKPHAEVRQYATLFKDYTCNGCGIGMTESEIAYTNDEGSDYCKDCNEAIQSDDESSSRFDALKQPVKQEEKGDVKLQWDNANKDHFTNMTGMQLLDRGCDRENELISLGYVWNRDAHSYISIDGKIAIRQINLLAYDENEWAQTNK